MQAFLLAKFREQSAFKSGSAKPKGRAMMPNAQACPSRQLLPRLQAQADAARPKVNYEKARLSGLGHLCQGERLGITRLTATAATEVMQLAFTHVVGRDFVIFITK